MLVPKNRRKRYDVGPGELIELRPHKPLPPDSTWQLTRSDVELQIVEQDESRAVVVLAGGAGDVNVALLSAIGKREPRPVCSWKFQLVDEALGVVEEVA